MTDLSANTALLQTDLGSLPLLARGKVRDIYAVGSEPDSAFADRGWTVVPRGDAHFLVTLLAMAVRSAGRDTDVVLEEEGPRLRVVRVVDGREIGSGRGAVDGDWFDAARIYRS